MLSPPSSAPRYGCRNFTITHNSNQSYLSLPPLLMVHHHTTVIDCNRHSYSKPPPRGSTLPIIIDSPCIEQQEGVITSHEIRLHTICSWASPSPPPPGNGRVQDRPTIRCRDAARPDGSKPVAPLMRFR
ncbi:hypothetical protein L6452_06863 [Arctium lappa]|uniref:Uncharacterized protein n=1 Tax=Arctium lappa TaxID=4217 RepID=A0ACB9EJN9_ARCLA|nr:hypothetical protein L6452_06863 [Arctium lappa]